MTSALSPSRHYEQSMGLWLNEPLLHHPDTIPGYIHRLADDGYEIVRLLLRKTNIPHESPLVVEAARVAAEAAHARGLRVVMDLEPHRSVARAMGMRFPAANAIKLVPCRARVVDGHWTLRIPVPANTAGPEPLHEGIEAAFLDGCRIPVPEARFEYATDSYGYGPTRDENDYVEHKSPCFGPCADPGPSSLWELTGRLAPGTDGELLLFYRVRDPGQCDFSAPKFRTYYAGLLELYRDTGIDGVSWDEPGEGNDWTAYRWGDAFPAFFERLCGYSPIDSLPLLDGPLTPEAAAFRLDFYRAQNESLREAQSAFLEDARRILGRPRLLTGNHHTWQGEGGINDYRCCEVDYFRLAESLDAGYTDCCWWDRRSVRYAYLLARALARLTPTGEAVVNSWHQRPSARAVGYHTRLMRLLRITWFNIAFGEATDTCLYPNHRTYPLQAAAMRRNRDFLRATAGASPLTEIAVLHDWEGVCGVNRPDLANLHKGFVMNLASLAVERSFPMEFIDTRLLATSRIEDGRLVNDAGDFSTIVVPDGVVLRQASWDTLVAFGRAGGTVVFAGAPPTLAGEGGDLSRPFAWLFGMEPVPFERYHGWFEANAQPLPDGRPEAYDAAYPVEAPHVSKDGEGRVSIVHSADGAFHWFAGYLPADDVADFLLSRWTPPARVFSETPVQYQFYRLGADIFLCAIAVGETPLHLVMGRDNAFRPIDGDTFVWEKL